MKMIKNKNKNVANKKEIKEIKNNKKGIWITIKNNKGEILGEFEAVKGEVIIETANKNGINMPIACGSGACFFCAVEVEQGGEYLNQDLAMQQPLPIDEGLFLPCIGGVDDKYFGEEFKDKYIQIVLKALNI